MPRGRFAVNTPPAHERVLARVTKEPNGCWLWNGYRQHQGYGRIHVTNTRSRTVHRVVYEALVGPIPEGLVLDHLCRVRNCVNPEHLEAVTAAENTRRSLGPAFQRRRIALVQALAAADPNDDFSPLIAEARALLDATNPLLSRTRQGGHV